MSRLTREITIREAYVQASSFLQHKHIKDAAVCVELLLCDLLDWSRSELLLHWSEPFPEKLRERWQQRLARKAVGEPVQYIIGEQSFYGLSFAVNPAVLIPRPETEWLVERIIALGKRLSSATDSVTAVDVGTGSGAIAIALAVHCPDWTLYAIDLSEDALMVAQANAAKHGVAGRIHWLQGDLLTPLIERNLSPQVVVSNPPYIRSDELDLLQIEVMDYEPRLALDGGPDGLEPYRRLMQQIGLFPQCPELVGFEVGSGQAPSVLEMMGRQGCWEEITIVPDLAGIERHVVGMKGQKGV